jgi:putative salt-induced outer membrane protein
MIDAAIASGNEQTASAVIALAKQTNPDDVAEIDVIEAAYKEQLAAARATKAEAQQAAIRKAGPLDMWKGRGEVGAFRSTGNTDNLGLSLAVTLDRKGVDWTHRLRGTADYQQSNGSTTREQYFASYEPRYQINDGLFAYGLAQYERDEFQGYYGRYALSGGLGYRVVANGAVNLSVKAGPAYRRTDYVIGGAEDSLAALAGIDFNWKINDRLSLTHDANAVAESGGEATVFLDSSNTSLNFVTGLDAKISNRLSTRLSYSLDYNSNPALNSVSTDTLSRFTLVYGF